MKTEKSLPGLVLPQIIWCSTRMVYRLNWLSIYLIIIKIFILSMLFCFQIFPKGN